jgi:hypothetical protein
MPYAEWIVGKLDIENCGPPGRANFLFARYSPIAGEAKEGLHATLSQWVMQWNRS